MDNNNLNQRDTMSLRSENMTFGSSVSVREGNKNGKMENPVFTPNNATMANSSAQYTATVKSRQDTYLFAYDKI
jgi:hypothetical protein